MQPVTTFRQAVELLKPGATGKQAAALLDNKVSRNVACNWLAGRRQAPQWALRTLARKIRSEALPRLAIADHLDNVPERTGLKAGAKNLAAYLARR